MIVVTTNAADVAQVIRRVAAHLQERLIVLNQEIGLGVANNVKQRIKSADGGTWILPSKWIRAKKDVSKALIGADRFVKWRASPQNAVIYGETGSDWTLSQHDKGFVNKLESEQDRKDGDRVVISILNPAPLGLKSSGDFRFKPSRPGITPARKIWPTPAEVGPIIVPIASRWLRKTVLEVSGVNP